MYTTVQSSREAVKHDNHITIPSLYQQDTENTNKSADHCSMIQPM